MANTYVKEETAFIGWFIFVVAAISIFMVGCKTTTLVPSEYCKANNMKMDEIRTYEIDYFGCCEYKDHVLDIANCKTYNRDVLTFEKVQNE